MWDIEELVEFFDTSGLFKVHVDQEAVDLNVINDHPNVDFSFNKQKYDSYNYDNADDCLDDGKNIV